MTNGHSPSTNGHTPSCTICPPCVVKCSHVGERYVRLCYCAPDVHDDTVTYTDAFEAGIEFEHRLTVLAMPDEPDTTE